MIRLKFPRLFECFQCKISHNFCCNERATDIRNNLLERNFTSLSNLSERLVSLFHRILSSLHRKTQQNYNIYIYVHAFAWAKCRGGSSFLSARNWPRDPSIPAGIVSVIKRRQGERGRCRLSCKTRSHRQESGALSLYNVFTRFSAPCSVSFHPSFQPRIVKNARFGQVCSTTMVKTPRATGNTRPCKNRGESRKGGGGGMEGWKKRERAAQLCHY